MISILIQLVFVHVRHWQQECKPKNMDAVGLWEGHQAAFDMAAALVEIWKAIRFR